MGDSPDDFAAAQAAGCFGTVMVKHAHNKQCLERDDVNIVVDELHELAPLLDQGLTADRHHK